MRIESDSGLPEKTYKSVVSSNEFPGNNASGSFTVRNDNDGKVILMEENVLPPCGSQCTSQDNYCITGNIIKIGDGSNNCDTITSNDQGSKALYFRKDYTLVSDPSTTNVPDIAYICTFGEEPYKATKCELIKGYTTSSTNMIYCSEWKNDPCTIVVKEDGLGDDSTCESIKKVKLIDTGKICTSIGGEAVSADKNIFLYPTEANEYYGIRMTSNNPDFVALSITKNEESDVADTVVVISNANFKNNDYGYQINPATIGSMEKALINCSIAKSISSCSAVNAQNGYYLGGTDSPSTKPNTLIKCEEGEGCTFIANADITNTYYIYALDKTKLIKCGEDCEIIDHNGKANAPTYFANDDTTMFSCTNNGCVLEDPEIKGYFLNGAGTSEKSLIVCDGSGCGEVADSGYESYSGVGSVKVSSDGVSVCIAVGCNGAGEVKIENSNSAPIYKTLKVPASTFPGVNDPGSISVKIGNDGSVLLLEELTLSTSTTVEYNFNDGKVKHYDGISNNDMTEAEAGTYIYFFNFENKKVSAPISGSLANIMAYQCVFVETDNEVDDEHHLQVVLDHCTQVKGYATIQNSSSIVQCSGWRREGCSIISQKACTAEDEGKLGTGKKLCFGTEAYSLPAVTETKPKYLAFRSDNINTNYGMDASKIIYLRLTPTSAIAINPEVESNTQFIIKVEDELKLYDYDQSQATFTENDDTGILAFDMVNDGYLYEKNDILDTVKTILFYCHKGVCKKSKGLILVGDKIYSNEDGEWDEVESDTTCAASTTATDIGKIKLEEGVIKLCLPAATSFAPIASDIYFLPSGTAAADGTPVQMYIAGNINTIIGIPGTYDGYYYIKNYKVEGTSDGTNAKLVSCEREKCKMLTTPTNGIYSNDGGVKLIGCSSGSCTLDDTTGYYLDVKSKLVKCTSGAECVVSDEIGYFKNAGEAGKYIQCTPSECKAVDPVGSCDSDAQVGKLVNPSGPVKLCLKNGNTVEFPASGSSNQLVFYQSGSVFRYYVNKSTYYGLVTVTANAMVINFDNVKSEWCVKKDTLVATEMTDACGSDSDKYLCNSDGVCIDTKTDTQETLPESIRFKKVVKEEEIEEDTSASNLKIECDVLTGKNCVEKNYYLVDKIDFTVVKEGSTGSLYYCETEDEACSMIYDIGLFIIDQNKGYACKILGGELTCEVINITENTCASASDVGKVFYDSNKISICLNYDTKAYAVELNSTNSGNYILEKDAENVFGLQSGSNYALINIKDKIITLNTK
eukprot:jgi/Orpsp1_1/1180890/evm.model.c7180000075024.2